MKNRLNSRLVQQHVSGNLFPFVGCVFEKEQLTRTHAWTPDNWNRNRNKNGPRNRNRKPETPQNPKFWAFGPNFGCLPDFSRSRLLQICRYWPKLAFCAVWAKSLEPFLRKWPKTLKNGHFDVILLMAVSLFFILYGPLT